MRNNDRRFASFVFAGLLSGSAFASCAAASGGPQPVVTRGPEILQLQVGETQSIRVPCNPSTGYSWEVEKTSDETVTVSKNGFQSRSDEPGAGGTCVFSVRGKKIGKATVALVYRRPWEGDNAAKDRFTAQITVVAAK